MSTPEWVPWPTHAGWWWMYCPGPWPTVVECLVYAFNVDNGLRVKDGDEFITPTDMRDGTRFLDARLTPPTPPETL